MDASGRLAEADNIAGNGSSEARISRVENHGGTATAQNKTSIKRACNECRQQKLRCDVVSDPFTICSRCRRLSLQCRTDAGFKRVEKRKAKGDQQHMGSRGRNGTTPESRSLAGLIEEQPSLRTQVVSNSATRTLPTEPILPPDLELIDTSLDNQWPETPRPGQTTTVPDTIRARENSLSSMSQRRNAYAPSLHSQSSLHVTPRTLDSIDLAADVIQVLFQQFFAFYHPFLPFLDPRESPDQYFHSSRLLFWVIISVASRRYSSDLTLLPSLCISVPKLLWSTLQSIPQNHHDVKALCILCTWPFPLNSSSLDPTFMLSGTMMHMAMQIGLHRPRNPQDFSKVKVTLTQENLEDRMRTWAACNIVAQSVSTGYGQPSITMYDWALFPRIPERPQHHLSRDLAHRLRIETLCDRITKFLYCDMSLMPGGSENREQTGITKLLEQQLAQLEAELNMEGTSSFNLLYIRCARLHFRLCILIEPGNPNNTVPSLLALYKACQELLSTLQSADLRGEDSVSENFPMHCPTYVFQMTLAAAFALLRMLRSSFKEYIDVGSAKVLLNSAILIVRRISVTNNDLPGRLADVLAQLWAKDSLAQRDRTRSLSSSDPANSIWQELQLKVRGRMSASVMFDSLLEWRKGFEANTEREASPPIQSRSNPSVDQLQEQEMPSNSAAKERISNAAPISMEWNLDGFPYEDSFYPLNWIVDSSGQTLDMSSQLAENMEA